MTHAVLKALHCADIRDLENYVPEDPECIGFSIEASYGPGADKGEEQFQMTVCTPAWLTLRLKDDEVYSARHHLIVKSYSYLELKGYLEKLGRRCSGNTWHEIAGKLSRYGLWEFEDYQPNVSK